MQEYKQDEKFMVMITFAYTTPGQTIYKSFNDHEELLTFLRTDDRLAPPALFNIDYCLNAKDFLDVTDIHK